MHREASRRVVACCAAVLCAGCVAQSSSTSPPSRVVLIGGPPSEGPGRHAYPDGVLALKTMLDASPDRPSTTTVTAHPDGWPAAPDAFDGAVTIVWWFDGDDRHPLRDAARRAHFDAAMRRGAGLVVLHQASTTPAADDLGLTRWLGGARPGAFDRTTQTATLTSVATGHPISRGLASFAYRDEFYPTIRFVDDALHLQPILRAALDVQYRDGRALVAETPENRTVAWAFERDGGGRSFGYTGAHFLAALDDPSLRTLLLNAIFWTAGIDVPTRGVRSTSLALAAPVVAPELLGGADTTTFHGDASRSGWHAHETVLSPRVVQDPGFGPVWESPPSIASTAMRLGSTRRRSTSTGSR